MPITLAEPPPAAVAPAPPRPSVITMPDWALKPAFEDVTKLYPKHALAANLDGRATIRCKVGTDGRLTGCQVLAEEPAGEGFGDAALAMAGLFKMRPMTKDGVPVAGGVISIPIRFQLPSSNEYLPPLPDESLDPRTTAAVKRPAPRDYARLYPITAARRDIEGRATLQCFVSEHGRLERCSVLQEDPPSYGFGEAAIRLSEYFQFAERTADGNPTAGRPIRIGIRFNLPGHGH